MTNQGIEYAKAKARLDRMIERTRQNYGNDAAAMAQRVANATLHAISSRPSDTPPTRYADENKITAFEAVDNKAKSVVAQWFDSEPGRKYRALAFLEGADDEIRSLYADALENISGFDVRPDELAVIATTRPGEYWKLGGQTTLQVVIEHVSQDIGCKLDSCAHTDFGPCMETHERMLAGIAKCDGIGKDGKPNSMRRTYIAENFTSVPFAIGNVIVLVKICRWCFGDFLGRNKIDTNRVGYVVPKTDGYGCVGAGPLTRDEYLWKKNTPAV